MAEIKYNYAIEFWINGWLRLITKEQYESFIKNPFEFFCSNPSLFELNNDGFEPTEFFVDHYIPHKWKQPRGWRKEECQHCGNSISSRNKTGYCTKHRHMAESVKIQKREQQRVRDDVRKPYK